MHTLCTHMRGADGQTEAANSTGSVHRKRCAPNKSRYWAVGAGYYDRVAYFSRAARAVSGVCRRARNPAKLLISNTSISFCYLYFRFRIKLNLICVLARGTKPYVACSWQSCGVPEDKYMTFA